MNKDFLAIDELRLDKDCMEQPMLYLEYSLKLADARQNYDETKVQLDLTEAELKQAIRNNPKRFDLDGEKITEAAINSKVPLQKEYKDAQGELSDAKHRVDVLSAAVGALDQRKRMLVLLVELRRQELSSEPRVSGDGKRAVEQDSKTRVRKLGQRLDRDDED